ncbi:MAG: hypothetical protein LBJ01_09805 [Tannerella sp.]|jgi:hypothetical protein|nr:hypothetical protein [Tannerella sp.]
MAATNNDKIYEVLLAQIRNRIPQNAKLVNTLVDILFIEKEAVYRRLRGEVPFTFHEIVTITRQMGISLDAIIGIESQKSRPLQLKLPDFLNPKKNDLTMMDSHIAILDRFAGCADAEMAVLTNIIPQDIFPGFDQLTKYIVFKWQYHYHSHLALPFREVVLPDCVVNAFKAQYACSKRVKNSNYVFDNQLCRYIVDDINYFRSIRMIDEEEVMMIRDDILRLLDYLEQTATSGIFEETGNRVDIYVADVDITTSYSYIRSEDYSIGMIKTFFLTSAISTDEMIVEKIRNWITATLRLSTLITVANERQRVLYFEKQREMARSL